jgi:hypothetical protein
MRSSLNQSSRHEKYALEEDKTVLFLTIPIPELELISDTILAVENVLQG